MKDVLDGVWELLDYGKKDNADEIIHNVDLNVTNLVENYLLHESPKVLIFVGRKGAHLFTHYKVRIEEKRFITCIIRLINFRFFHQRPSIPPGSNVILLTDTIHTGDELGKVIAALKTDNVKTEKIFCYLVNEEGARTLMRHKLVKKENIIGLYSSASEEEYLKESKQLQVFFRSRIEPMDPDLCYNLYNVNTKLEAGALKGIVSPILKEFFGQTEFSIKESIDRGLASNIKELFCYVDNCKKIEETVKVIFKPNFDLKIDCISIRFKINQKRVDSDFSVIIKTHVNCELIETTDPQECLNNPENCLLKHTTYEKTKEYEVKKMTCPSCIDLLLSDQILNEMDSFLIKAFDKKDLSCKLKRRDRPTELHHP